VRIAVCDYSGHPFQVQLSRELARRGHDVLHLHFADFQTPKGRLSTGKDDSPTFSVEGISLGVPFAKDKFMKRRRQEIEVGRKFVERLEIFSPDVVISSNLPLDALIRVARRSRRSRWRFVYWQQDIWSVAISRILTEKIGLLGRLIGSFYKRIERRALQISDAIVVISEDFLPILACDFDIDTRRVAVVENWAPLDEIVVQPKDNTWSRAQNLVGVDVVLYTGTLGMKHDPGQILDAAEMLRSRPKTVFVVTSEGIAAEWLKDQAIKRGLTDLRVLPFQPYEDYPQVLGSADVLVSILEADAGQYSVPSKVLSYLNAGRPIVLSAPPENLAFRTVSSAKAGYTIPAGNHEAFSKAILALLEDKAAGIERGRNARAYAERMFDIARIGDVFEGLCSIES
jgi:glycosyltransferase involved in cell wall biosynthesis